jgi:serine/threonine-protein kinase
MNPSHTPGGHLKTGTVLDGRYEITGFVGAGGFALVYKAREMAIGRDIAIKILSAPREGDDFINYRNRFMREAQTAARVRHPNVVTIHGFGVLENQPYIVMELLEGYDLNDELRKLGPMTPTRALKHLGDVLDALGEAHQQGVIHKDLKPANLFIHHPGTRREVMKVLDFGIACIGPKGGHLTTTGQLMGTPRYYAPEYIKNQVVTPALDVYQMGLILVEVFTGKPVVNADDPYVCLMRHSDGDLEVPEVLLESPLGPVILKALDGDHQSRFTDCHEFRRALEEIDPASIPPVPDKGPVRLVSEISGSMDSFAFHTRVHTGSMASPASDSGNMRHPDAVFIDAEGYAAPDRAATAGPGSGPLPRPVGRSARLREMAARPEPAPLPRRRVGAGLAAVLGVVALLLLITLAAGGAYLALNPEEPAVVELEEVPPTPTPVVAKGPVEVRLVSEPSGARVYLGERSVGRTPHRHDFADDEAGSVLLRLQLSGYKEVTVEVSASDTPVKTVTLAKAEIVVEPGAEEPKNNRDLRRAAPRRVAPAPVRAPRVKAPAKRPPASKERDPAKMKMPGLK